MPKEKENESPSIYHVEATYSLQDEGSCKGSPNAVLLSNQQWRGTVCVWSSPFFDAHKNDRKGALKIRLVGFYEYSNPPNFSPSTMTEEYETGAIYVIYTFRCFTTCKAVSDALPDRLFV